ncbi:MAG TPA: LPS assembly protein LptD [Rhizomicrobium sp.]
MARRSLLLASLTTALLFAGADVYAAKMPGGNSLLGPRGGDVLMKADNVTYDTTNQFVTASGHVEIDHNDRIMTADTVTYDKATDTVVATGNVMMMSPNGDVVFSPRATLTNAMKDGAMEGFRGLIGKTGKIAGTYAARKDGTVTTITRATFTQCKICSTPGQRIPLWDVKAHRAVYNQEEHKIRYYDATLEAFGVPIAYTPYFSQADPTVKRASGFLAPDIGTSSTLGSFVRIPYYVSLTDSQDFTVDPILSTSGGEVLEGEYRQRWNNGGMWLQASIANNPHNGINDNQDQWYSSLFGSGRIPISDNADWKAGYDLQLTSNPTYLERYNLYNKDDQLFNDLFVEGESGRSRFAITGYFFQSTVGACNTIPCPVPAPPISPLFIPNSQIPIVLPLIDYSYIPETTVLGGDFKLNLNTASIERDTGPTDQRATMEMRWQLPLVTDAGQLITFRFDVRGDVYHTTNNDALDFPNVPLNSRYVSRGLPYAGVDWRWPFVSGGGAGNTAYVIEPILQAIVAPYGGNPKGIPNEDSTDIELGDNDVFSFDRLPGYDLVETGPRANVGVRAEALLAGGSVEALVGEVLRLKPDPIFTEDSGLGGKTSDIVGRFTIKLPPHFTLTHRIDVDQSTGNVRRNEVYIDGTWGRSNVEISYVRLPQEEALINDEVREEVNGQATINLFDNWIGFAGAQRDLATSEMLDDEFGFGYDDECLGISLSYRRIYTRDRDVPPSTAILLRFELKTGDQTDHTNQLFPRHLFSATNL